MLGILYIELKRDPQTNMSKGIIEAKSQVRLGSIHHQTECASVCIHFVDFSIWSLKGNQFHGIGEGYLHQDTSNTEKFSLSAKVHFHE